MITERIQAEEALRTSANQLRLFIDNAPVALAMFDREMRYLAASHRWLSDFGLSSWDRIEGRSHYEIFPEIPERWREVHRRGLAGEVLREEEDRFDRHDGSVQWLRWEVRPWRGGDGGVGGIIIFAEEITARKEAVNALRASEAVLRERNHELQAIYDTAPVGLCLVDRDLRFVRINERLAEMNGLPAAEHIGRTVRQIVPALADQVEPAFLRVMETGEPVIDIELRGQTSARPGVERVWLESWYPHRDADGRVIGINIVAQEITERKLAEEALRASEERLRAFLESSAVIAWLKDEDGRYVFLSRNYEVRFGVRQEDWLGKTDDELWPPAVAAEFRRNDAAVLTSPTGRREAIEHTFNPDGSKSSWFNSKFVFRDRTGRRFVGGLGVDITAQIQAEASLREADRHKDEFLAMLAHELRNPLAPISNALSILKIASDRESLDRVREVMTRQVGHLVRLIDDLLDVSRISRGKLGLRTERIELAPIIDQALETCRSLIDRAGHHVTVTLPPQPISLDGDPIRLVQAFGNLLNNACKFTQDGGRISLTADRHGSDVVVSVKDNGIGIPPDKLGGIFEMFSQVDRSLERSHGGLGIGLTLVKRVVELHGGGIEVRSGGVAQGSEFIVRLPLHGVREAPPPERPEPTGVR